MGRGNISSSGIGVSNPAGIPSPVGKESLGIERPASKDEGPRRSALPLNAGELKKLTTQVKSLGIPLTDLLDSQGKLSPEKWEEAKLRIVGEAKRRMAKNPSDAARLYQHALKLEPKNLTLRTELAKAKLAWSNQEEQPQVRKKLILEGREELKRVLQEDPRHPEALQTFALSLGLDSTWLNADGSIHKAKANAVRSDLLGQGPRSLETATRSLSFSRKAILPSQDDGFRKNLIEAVSQGTEFSLLSPADQKAALREFLTKKGWDGRQSSELLGELDGALEELRERTSPARKLAQAAVLEGKDLAAKGDAAGAGDLYAAAVQMDPAHSTARMKLALALLKAGKPDAARNAMARAVQNLEGPAALEEMRKNLADSQSAALLGGKAPWVYLADQLKAAAKPERLALAKIAYERAAEELPGNAEASLYRRQAQEIDEQLLPYGKEFTTVKGLNPAAQVLYQKLKAQGVLDAELDIKQDRRLGAEEVFDYIGKNIGTTKVQAVLQAAGIEISKANLAEIQGKGFAACMAARHAANAARIQKAGEKENKGAQRAELEMALYFDPKNLARYEALADALVSGGDYGSAVGVLAAGLGLAPGDARLKRKIFEIHARGLQHGLEEAKKREQAGDLAGAKAFLIGMEEQQEILRSLIDRKNPLDSALDPKQVESFDALHRLGQAKMRLAGMLEKEGKDAEAGAIRRQALESLDAALRADPKHEQAVRVLRFRHEVHHALGDYAGALADLRAAADKVPFDIPGILEPHREAMEYEKSMRQKLKTAGAEKTGKPGKLEGAARTKTQSERSRTIGELRALLGPMVPAIYRDAGGGLDLSKIPAKNFSQFKTWLSDQLEIEGRKLAHRGGEGARLILLGMGREAAAKDLAENDAWKMFFGNFRQSFQSGKFDGLLRTVYAELDPEFSRTEAPLPKETAGQLRALTRELITVSPNSFVSSHLGSQEGRTRLRAVLQDTASFDKQTRVDLVRALARAKGVETTHGLHAAQIEKKTSTVDLLLFSVNVSNVRVDGQDIDEAMRRGVALLNDADEVEAKTSERRERYLIDPEKVRVLPGHAAGMDGRKIVPEEIKKNAELVERNRNRLHPVAQMKAKLAGLWLLSVDQDNWREDSALATPKNRVHLLKGAERLLQQLDRVKTPEQFRQLNQDLQDLLKKPLPSGGSLTREVDETLHETIGMSSGLAKAPPDMFEGKSAADREPFDTLLNLSDEWVAAFDMGESVSLEVVDLAAKDPKLKQAVEGYIQGLEGAKRGLWHGYKQKHWLYRGLSAEGGGATDAIPDIRAANRAIDGLIARLKQAQNPEDLEAVNRELFATMKGGGALHKGFSAAAMDWSSELSSLASTTLETALLSVVSGGAAAAGRVLRTLRGLKSLEGLAGGISAASKIAKDGKAVSGASRLATSAKIAFDSPFVRAALLGSYISVAENTGAKLSGQLKTEPDTILTWFKDAASTGLAMTLVAPLQPHAVRARGNLFRQMWSRYASDPRLGPLRFVADTVQEAMEEVLDTYIRQTLDGDYRAMSWEEFRDIVSICAFGGAQMGMTKQIIGGGRIQGVASRPKAGPVEAKPGVPLAPLAREATAGSKPDSATQVPASGTAPEAAPREVFEDLKVVSAEEILQKGRRMEKIARQVGQRSLSDYLALPAARSLSPRQRRIAESAFTTLASHTSRHFREGRLSGLENPYFRGAALAQHVGYLAGELERKFPELNRSRAQAILSQHFENPSRSKEELGEKLQDAARGGDIRRFVLDEQNGWMFGGFGDLDHALNLPGVYAGQALVKFATALAGDRRDGKALLQRFYDASPEELRRLMETPKGELGLIAHFAARAAQASWLVSKLGQGYVEAAAGKGAKGLSRWTGELIAPFDEMAAKKGWAEVVKDLDQTRSYLQHRFGDEFSVPPSHRGTHFLTDLEGRRDAVDKLVEAGQLRWVDGKLDFVHPKDPNEKLVFGGDLPDRGSDSIKLVEWLVDLKKRYPERVTLLWGNRDLNKLGLLRDLPQLQQGKDPAYHDWLRRKYPEASENSSSNALDHQVEYWLESRGNQGALERHRAELEEILGKPVSREVAARDFVDRIKPGGAFFEYLRLGQVLHADRSVLYVHGGVTASNLGVVPGKAEKIADARQWIRELNAWGQAQLAQVARAHETKGMGEHVPATLLAYGDAIWDSDAVAPGGNRGVAFMNDQSVIYPFRQLEDGNFRGPSQEVVDFFRAAGIDTEINGHSPFGDVPGPIKTPGFLRVMADTSYGSEDAGSSLTVDSQGGVWVEGRTSRSGAVEYRASAASKPPIGYVTEDGFTVVGSRRSSHGRFEFLLAKYYGGYQIAEKLVSRRQLEELKPHPAKREGTEETEKHRDILIANLRQKGKRLHTMEAVAGDLIGEKRPVLFSGASKFGQYPASAETVEAEIRNLLTDLDPKKTVLLTGGTDHGVEAIVHQVARERGFQTIGFIQEGAIPGEIDLVDDLVIAGARNQWADPLLAALNLVKARQGLALFVGGGGTVREGILAAEAAGVDFYLMAKAETEEGGGGASGELAPRFPERAFHHAREFRGKAEQSGHKIFHEGESVTSAAPSAAPAKDLPRGEHWEVVKSEVGPDGEVLLTARALSFDPRGEAPFSVEGNLHYTYRQFPVLAEKWGIRPNPDGSVTYPDREGLNRRLEKAGFSFRFWETNESETNDQGEADLLPYLKHLDREPVEFPWSEKGSHHFHDLVAHGVGYAALPKEVLAHIRDVAGTYRRLIAHPDLQEPALQKRIKHLAQDFVDGIDAMTGLLTDEYLRLQDEGSRRPEETRDNILSDIEARLAGGLDESIADILQAVGNRLDSKDATARRALVVLRKMEAEVFLKGLVREAPPLEVHAQRLLEQSLDQVR